MGHLQRVTGAAGEVANNHSGDGNASNRNQADKNVGCEDFGRIMPALRCCLRNLQLDHSTSH